MRNAIPQTTNVHATSEEAFEHLIKNIAVMDVDSQRAGGFFSVQVTPGHSLLIDRSHVLEYANALTAAIIDALTEEYRTVTDYLRSEDDS